MIYVWGSKGDIDAERMSLVCMGRRSGGLPLHLLLAGVVLLT